MTAGPIVHVRFSRHHDDAHSEEKIAEGKTLSPGYIAVVEDDTSIRRAMARLLAAYSFHAQTFASGQEFLASLKTRKPVCLILDLHLRNGMSGLDVMHHLSGAGSRIPTIVATAHDGAGIRHRCELAGANAFLVKPIVPDILLKTITSVAVSERAIVTR